jgi:hypothetical protein
MLFSSKCLYYKSACIVLVKGYAVAQLVEALRYKLQGRGFSMGYLGIFTELTRIKNEYQGYHLALKTACK